MRDDVRLTLPDARDSKGFVASSTFLAKNKICYASYYDERKQN